MQGDFLGAFGLCREILNTTPDSIPALLLFGRLCIVAGEHITGAGVLQAAAGLADPPPGHAVQLLSILGETGTSPADLAFARAVAIDPDIERHASQQVFAQPVPLVRHVETSLREAAAHAPESARAQAALGNMLMRTGRIEDGLNAYAHAVTLEGAESDILFGYAERLRLFNRTEEARAMLRRALAISRTILEPAAYDERLSVLVLYSDDFWERFVALGLLADREHVSLQKDYVHAQSAPPPGSSVCFNALTDPDDTAALQAVAHSASLANVRCLNDPAAIQKTARTYFHGRKRVHPLLHVPATVRASKAALSGGRCELGFPFLIRPVGTHRGEGLAQISGGGELASYLSTAIEEEFFVSEYVEYRSGDGYYRKYRFIFIAGVPHPHHLAISSAWMVHYFNSEMREHAWMRSEEAAFLQVPQSAFTAGHMEALGALGREIGLDYFGVDCTVHNGKVLVFEANANMLAHDFFDEAAFAYKSAPFEALKAAFNAMLFAAQP